jgi:predicted CoA-binding protein
MPFENPSQAQIESLLMHAKVIAIVGLSNNPERPSYRVGKALVGYGYRVIPVTPGLQQWQGIRAVPDLHHLGDVLTPGEQVDIVDVFRQPQFVAAIVDQCIELHLPALWLQLGVIDVMAAERARRAGITVVMDRCMRIERTALANKLN